MREIYNCFFTSVQRFFGSEILKKIFMTQLSVLLAEGNISLETKSLKYKMLQHPSSEALFPLRFGQVQICPNCFEKCLFPQSTCLGLSKSAKVLP